MPAHPTKILLADDDRLDRKLLCACLEKAGYAVHAVEDGIAALRALLQPDAPPVALLDWTMPGLTGPEVCAKLRSVRLRVRPYVIMLTAKTDKPDVANALDAGADDFVTKPFNSGELLARLRVALRTLGYQAELQKQLRAFETLAERYNLLGEIAALNDSAEAAVAAGAAPAETTASAGAAPLAGSPAVAPHADAAGTAPAPLPIGILPPEDIAELATRFLHERGVAPVHRLTMPPDGRKPGGLVTAWSGLIVLRENLWIDLLLETELASASSVFAKFLSGRSSTGHDLPGFLAEAQTILGVMYKSALQDRGHELLTPFLSHARPRHPAQPVPAAERTLELHFDAGGAYLGVTIVQTPLPPQGKTAKQLRNFDVVAEPFPPAHVDSVPLLQQGVVLNERYIGKITAFDETKLHEHAVPVYPPTTLALHFCASA